MPRPARPLRFPALAGTVVAAVVGVACGSGGDGACGPVQREPLDRRAVHVLPGAPAPHYLTDPPTSGPHQPAPVVDPVQARPLAPTIQVGLLEEGRVLVQHAGLDPAGRAAVEGLAGDGVVVAPAPSLPGGAAVVATAWVTKQVCTDVDVDALARFAADHRGRGPGDHG